MVSQTLYLPCMTPTQKSRSTTNWSECVISQTLYLPYMTPTQEVGPLQTDLNLWLAKLSSLSCMSMSLGFQALLINIYMCIYSLLHPCFYSNRWVIYTCIHHSQMLTHRKWLVDYSPCFICSLQNSHKFNQVLKQGYKPRTPKYRFTNVCMKML